MNLIGRLICLVTRKHLRGKKTGVSSALGVQFQCERCRAVWNRKASKRKEKA